jgi:hypothetical protein
MALLRRLSAIPARLLRSGTGVVRARRARVMKGTLLRLRRLLLRRLSMQIRLSVRVCGGSVRLIVMPLEVFGMSVLPSSRLRNVRDDLHSARNDTSRSSTSSSVGGSSRTTKSLGKLLDKGACNVVCCDVDSVRNTKNNKRSLRGQGQASI